MRKPLFYTYPPYGIHYPYLLLNRRNYRYIFRSSFRHAIIDSGVSDFIRAGVTDYPESFLNTWMKEAQWLQSYFGDKLWFVIPDYPDDHNPGQFGDNVQRTIDRIQEYLRLCPEVNWLPVIQSRYHDQFSFIESCEKLKSLGYNYKRLAIGTVCKSRSVDFIEFCCEIARGYFPTSWIHAFGLTLKALPKVSRLIDSFDSLA